MWEVKIFHDLQNLLRPLYHCFNLICLEKGDPWYVGGDGYLAFRPLNYHDGMQKLDIQIIPANQ